MTSRLLRSCIVCLVFAGAGTAGAATLEGQRFDDGVRLANQQLQLNGVGVRAVMFIKGYVAALYLHEKAASLQDMVEMQGAKRLQLRMLHGAAPEDFNKALASGIRKNTSEGEFTRLQARIGQLEQTILSIGGIRKGDVINFDYLPELGTTLSVNGAGKGAAIAGADFYAAVLGIFVGEHPVDPRLKRGLLGQ